MRARWRRSRTAVQAVRFDPRYGPVLLQLLGERWRLAEHERRLWWTALQRAQWSEATAWRQCVLGFHPSHEDVATFVDRYCGPRVVIPLLEQLVHEQGLSRQVATAIEEKVLAQLDARAWPVTVPDDLAAIIEQYWR